MVLPSQMRRPAGRRRRTTNRGRRVWPWLAAVVAVAIILFMLFSLSNSPEPAVADNNRPTNVTDPGPTGRAGPSGGMVDPVGPASVNGMSDSGDTAPSVNADPPVPTEPTATSESDPVQIEAQASTALELDVIKTIKELDLEAKPSKGEQPEGDSVARVVPKMPSPAEPEQAQINVTVAQVQALIDRGQSVEARRFLSEMLGRNRSDLAPATVMFIRQELNKLNQRLFFSKAVVAGDPLAEHYAVPPGDNFTKIGRKYSVPYALLMRINGIKNDTSLRAGREIKALRGPLHVIITKSDYSMDIYAPGPQGKRIFVKSFTVGLGMDDSTPSGQWVVGRGKTINPDWQNPRTREYFERNHPANPIGEYWIPLRGVDAKTEELRRYGIHGTIDPDSIGRQASMGCVRLLPNDIELVYQLLVEELSQVTIR